MLPFFINPTSGVCVCVLQNSFWESRRLPSGSTPLLFRGNKTSTSVRRVSSKETEEWGGSSVCVQSKDKVAVVPEAAAKAYAHLTDSLMDALDDSTEDKNWKIKLLDETEVGLDWDEMRNVDRQWYVVKERFHCAIVTASDPMLLCVNRYDSEESSYFQHEGYFDEDQKRLGEKEEHLKFRQSQLDQVKRRQKLNLRESLRNADQELWEVTRLRQSGLSMTALGMGGELETARLLYELPSGEGENDTGVHILVREIKPPFLDGRIVYTSQIETVPTIRDPTADLAVLAKRGSAVVRQLREQEDRSKMRQRFWELGGTALGEAIGLKHQDKTSQELKEEAEGVTDDYKKDSQFAGLLRAQKDTAVSAFARSKTIAQQRQALPIYEVRDEFLSMLRDHEILVVVGQTGSGKTTQLTQYLYEEGYAATGVLGCTQPRRVAAVSVAKRVADEMDVTLGEEVGYAIRFEDCTSPRTVIAYMTDGILLRESLTDPDLDRYSVIIMDEAHERSLNTDILFGILRGVVGRRRDFRLIVTSATMNANKFAEFFGGCPVFDIPGRTFPVRIEYTRVPVEDYVDAAVQRCLQVHCSLAGADENADDPNDTGKGDILMFMTGQEDIEAACYLIADRCSKLGDRIPPLAVLPIYSTLPSDLQAKIFEKNDLRKVIVATNIAETSLTVDGIRYVIDCGYSKLKVYNPKIGMDSLQVCPISQANAQQRAGRAGRTGSKKPHR